MILGVDYGLRNIGLAISEGEIAEPKETVQMKDNSSGIKEIEKRAREWGVDRVIMGVSEGRSKDQALRFGKKLAAMLRLPVTFVDETLTTVEANSLRKQAKSKKIQEHARAAAIILQRYLDNV